MDYNPRRDRPHDADLCEQGDDGTVRDAAGRLIYRPGRHYTMKVVPSANRSVQADFSDPTFEEAYANIQRVRHQRGR